MAKQKKKDVLLIFFCIILSFSLWVYIINVENPTKSMKVYNVPVRIENLENISEQNLALLPNQDFMVTLSVKGPASDVYRSVASNFRVVADLEDLPLKKGTNEIPITITDSPSELDVSPSSNLKVTIVLDDFVERDINIVSQYEASPEIGKYINGITFNPSTSKVRGAAEYVNRVTSLAARGERGSLSKNHQEIVTLIPLDENNNEVNHVMVSPLYVEVSVEVFDTKTVPITVTSQGEVGEGLELKELNPSITEILITGPTSLLSQVNEIVTEKVDLANITEAGEIIKSLVIPEGIIPVNGVTNVTVLATVEIFETKTISKKLTITGLGTNFKAELSASSINITISGTKLTLDAITDDVVSAEIVLNDLNVGVYEITPTVTLPVGVNLKEFNPQVISVTITENGALEETPGETPGN
ncbi:MAG: hypothetical protein GX829_09290 [Clostridium sp.]|nr:hypothetical protein [Clostridium sp.]